jgi:hypothetical protein
MTKPNFKAQLLKPPKPTKESLGYFSIRSATSPYKEIKKERRICLARFWQAREAEEEARTGFNAKMQQKSSFNRTSQPLKRISSYDALAVFSLSRKTKRFLP